MPTKLTISFVFNTSLTLRWLEPPLHGSPIRRYLVWGQQRCHGEWGTWVKHAEISEPAVPVFYADRLMPETTYRFRVSITWLALASASTCFLSPSVTICHPCCGPYPIPFVYIGTAAARVCVQVSSLCSTPNHALQPDPGSPRPWQRSLLAMKLELETTR